MNTSTFLRLRVALTLLLAAVAPPIQGAAPSRCVDTVAEGPRHSLDGVPIFGYRVVDRYPHDRAAFTQGLLYLNGVLFESTGQYGHSELRRVDLAQGEVQARVRLANNRFAEGLASDGQRLVQLTWRAGEGRIHRLDDLRELDRFRYSGEGWGLAHDGRRYLLSNGSATLRFLHSQSLRPQGEVEVRDGCGPVRLLNELEAINGKVWANVWMTDYIVVVDPDDGQVLAWVDLSGLLPVEDHRADTDVLNGIAYDPADKTLLLTGKYWPWLYRVRLVRPGRS